MRTITALTTSPDFTLLFGAACLTEATIKSPTWAYLLPEPPRNESGHRRYTIDALRRTEFIKRTQSLGFSLNEISDLLSLRVGTGTTCADVKTRVEMKIKDVQEKIVDLKDIEHALIRLADKCSGKGPVGQCPILEELYK